MAWPKRAYIRESRRIQAEFTVLEQHVGTEMRTQETRQAAATKLRPKTFPDSVGVGCYRIDLHPSAGGTNYIDVSSLPFQIPLGCADSQTCWKIYFPRARTSATHITNGCYRLHPVEWNIGESAGVLAAKAVAAKEPPRAFYKDLKRRAALQADLQSQGVELDWPRIHPV